MENIQELKQQREKMLSDARKLLEGAEVVSRRIDAAERLASDNEDEFEDSWESSWEDSGC